MFSIKILNNFSDAIFNQKYVEFEGILFNGLDNYKLDNCEYILVKYDKNKINSICPILYNSNKYIIFCCLKVSDNPNRTNKSNQIKGFYIECNQIKKLRLEFEDLRTTFNYCDCVEIFDNFVEYEKKDFVIYNLIDNLD